jgi:hypothetical protein
VNLYYVEEYSRKEGVHLRLNNGLQIPVSGLHREPLLQQLLALHTTPSEYKIRLSDIGNGFREKKSEQE